MSTNKKIVDAIENGEIVMVSYSGGSQPGATRKIAPLSIKDGRVRAKCYTSNAIKTFLLEKLHITEADEPSPVFPWQPNIGPLTHYGTAAELIAREMDSLVAMGWHVKSDLTQATLHRLRKNGAPLKTSDVSIKYEEYTHDSVMDLNGNVREENKRKKLRPWTVRARGKNTKTLGTLDKAAESFLAWAKLLGPLTREQQ